LKLYRQIIAGIAKLCDILIIALIGGIVFMIVAELINRNVFNGSFRASIEICGILFMWMAFLGIVSLYHRDAHMRFEILLSRVKEPTLTVLWYMSKLCGLMLGVVMVISFFDMFPYFNTRTYSTIPSLPYTVHFLPMAIAGAFMALKSVEQMADRIGGARMRAEKGGE
jgi:TRAP-type C4-dicarboxylate transport system permease small subunit